MLSISKSIASSKYKRSKRNGGGLPQLMTRTYLLLSGLKIEKSDKKLVHRRIEEKTKEN